VTPGAAQALRPLYLVAAGAGLATAGAHLAVVTGPSAAHWALAAAGIAALLLAARAGDSRRAALLWLAAGLAMGSARGLPVRQQQLGTAAIMLHNSDAAVRFRARIEDGWAPSRWGRRTRVRVTAARVGSGTIALPTRLSLEVRGAGPGTPLPRPGSLCSGLASLRGDPFRPFLAAASPRLIVETAAPTGIGALRNGGVHALLRAAGTSPPRIRAAELASALVFGRRELLPRTRRDRWRLSGLAHVLAVSGLHVGLLGGMLWLAAIALGASPNAGRLLVLAVVPSYALLAGASPSAIRATAMVVLYLVARMMGRPIVPMAAVLLAATGMLLIDPSLIASVSFQLTVGITAALVRWVPAVSAALPLPRWLAAAVSVPVVAQLAAAPLVAWHFRTLIPGAVVANLLAPLLLGPTLLAAFLAAVLALLAPAAAGVTLRLLDLLSRAVLACGLPARAHMGIVPLVPVGVTALLIVLALAALWPGRRARLAAAVWVVAVLFTPLVWRLLPSPGLRGPTLLPVRDGLAAVLPAPGDPVLLDGGRLPDEAARLLADLHIRRLGAVIASHTDEDHCGGLPTVIGLLQPRRLLLPAWMTTDPAAVPLLRAARRAGAAVVPLARQLRVSAAGDSVTVLWPSFRHPPSRENDRSLVARISIPGGSVLVTSDTSSRVERVLAARRAPLATEVLIAGHHGSASSTSMSFLRAVHPACVLIPAAPWNTHHHPSPATLARLHRRRIPWRAPKTSGLCGAERIGERWRCWP